MSTIKSGCDIDFYGVLGVSSRSSAQEIRRAYHKLAMQWHPDKWARCPSLWHEANTKFQQIQQAYSVLSDEKKRTIYDAGLYEDDVEDEGFSDFLQEMISLIAQTRRQDKGYSLEELQGMLDEMAKDFGPPMAFHRPGFQHPGYSKRTRMDTGCGYFGSTGFCS